MNKSKVWKSLAKKNQDFIYGNLRWKKKIFKKKIVSARKWESERSTGDVEWVG